MNDDTEGWFEHPTTQGCIKDLKKRYNAQVEALIGAAEKSSDPAMRSNWASINTLAMVISQLEAERGK